MIIAANRPYFAPFPGFFYRIHLADVFVVLDNIQFPRGTTWITRNRFKNDQGTLWMTIPVWKKGLGLQNIDEVRLCREGNWPRKHPASLKQAYANAPYFYEHLQFIENLFSTAAGRLVDFNLAVIRHLMLNLGLDTEIIRLSELNIDAGGDHLLIEICRYFDASVYLASGAAGKYLNAALFEKAGIELRFVHPRSPVYPQLWSDFIPDLSTFDLLFNCGPKARDILLAQ
ncbi:MAG: WbqC family protein [Desulfobacterales bacterium]|nr:MAG: WbqC family protein [Desulfobacterales bacterium]